MSQAVQHAVLRTDVTELKAGAPALQLALFDTEGNPVSLDGVATATPVEQEVSEEIAALTEIDVDDAEEAADDIPTAEEFNALVALANANKAKLNEIVAALKA